MKSFKKYLMSGSVVSAVLLAMLTMPVQAKTVWLEADDYRLAEGDAEEVPAEIISEPIAVEKTPTITAEGEFILPTYVMPDAQPAVKSSVAVTDNANPFRVEEKAVVTAKELGFGDIEICPETMGKINQLGLLEEIVEMCKIDEILVPTIDFGHINAREMGILKTEEDFEKIIKYMINELGEERGRRF